MARDIDTLGTRLRKARTRRGLTQDELATRSGMKQPDISKIERGGILQTTGIGRLAAALSVPVRWLELGEGPEPNWSNKQHSTGGLVSLPVAHVLSHPDDSNAPLLSWEQLMSEDLPPVFRVALRDASLAPMLLPGDELVIERGIEPAPGDLIIIKDAAGALYAREYRQRRPGAWSAHAVNEAFEPMRSDEDGGLEIVGVCIEERRMSRRSRRT